MAYQSLFLVASTAVLLPYFFSGAFAWKLAQTRESYAPGESRRKDFMNGIISTVYAAWLMFAAGLDKILTCSVLYALGMIFYVISRKQRNEAQVFTKPEKILVIGLICSAGYSGVDNERITVYEIR